MFKRKIKLVFAQEEYRVLVHCLMEYRNKLLADNRYTDAVDELLLKICK